MGVHVAYGVRYYVQNDPTILDAAVPRLGILWSPTKKGTWTLHAHAGMFSGRYGESDTAEILREDGTAARDQHDLQPGVRRGGGERV